MNGVDPRPRQIRQGGEVGLAGQHIGLEAPYLARRSGFLGHYPAASDPAHRRVMAKAVGVIDILVPGKAAEHQLPELRRQGVATVLAGPKVGQHLPGHLRQAKGIVQFPEGEQPGIRRDPRTMELQLEGRSKQPADRPFPVHPSPSPCPATPIASNALILISKLAALVMNCCGHLGAAIWEMRVEIRYPEVQALFEPSRSAVVVLIALKN